MKYLGLDVHSIKTVWCLLDTAGEVVGRGKAATTRQSLRAMIKSHLELDSELTAAQEVGTKAWFVHDVISDLDVTVRSFNAHQIRMICSSRKKTDRRDAYWLARCVQSGIHPHPVWVPTAKYRELRGLLHFRQSLVRQRTGWMNRARSHLRAAGEAAVGKLALRKRIVEMTSRPQGIPTWLQYVLTCSAEQIDQLNGEVARVGGELQRIAQEREEVARLMTIPGVGIISALTIVATVGDVSRFRNARLLCAYAGLVPTIEQSANSTRLGHINKQGSAMLRSVLVEAAQALRSRCKSEDARPLQAIIERIYERDRTRKKAAIVAGARHLLRIAFYILRDGTAYEPERLRSKEAVTV